MTIRLPNRSRINLCLVLVLRLFSLVQGESLHGQIGERSGLAVVSAGKPMAGVKICLYDASGKIRGIKTTAKNGSYRFTNITPGTYTLALSRKDLYPYPLLRVVTIEGDDTLSRPFLLDKLPMESGIAVQKVGKLGKGGKKKNGQLNYYSQLAEGMELASHAPAFFREATENKITLSRFYDSEDTTKDYHELWWSLSWAELQNQTRPIASMIYLAHALDSVLKASGLISFSPAALQPLLLIPSDSVESLLHELHMQLVSPSKKIPLQNLTKHLVPKSLLISLIEEQMEINSIPKAKKKFFLLKMKSILGGSATTAMLAKLEPKRPSRNSTEKKNEPITPPETNMEAFWKLLETFAEGKHPNAVALFHLAKHNFEQGHFRESLTKLDRIGALRQGYPQAVLLSAQCQLGLKDTTQAATLFDSLSKTESPDWQALGFQGLAQIQWKQGQGEKAEATLWRALGLDSHSAKGRQALWLLAEVSLTRESSNAVEPLLDSILRIRPREAEAHYWLGKMALKRNQDGVALDHFRKATSFSPKRIEFSVATAQAYFAREECDMALKTLKPLRTRLNGEGLAIFGQCLLLKGRPLEAVEEFQRLYSSQPSPTSLVPLSLALSASGKTRKAIEMLEASAFTKIFEVRKAIAECQLDLDSADAAKRLLGPLLSEKEGDAELHFLSGRAALLKREYSKATDEFSSALRYREDYPAAKYQQGNSLLKLGRAGEAQHYFQELIDSDKPSWHAKGLLGRGQAFAKENKLEAALENLNKSYEAAPSAEAAAHLSTTYMRMENTDQAARWADQALKLDPAEPLGLMTGIDVLFSRHQDAQALARAQTGLDHRPNSCEFLIVAAKANLRAGQDERAKTLSLKAKELCPEEAAPHFFLGTLASRTGSIPEARKHFEEYLRSGGDAKKVPAAYR